MLCSCTHIHTPAPTSAQPGRPASRRSAACDDGRIWGIAQEGNHTHPDRCAHKHTHQLQRPPLHGWATQPHGALQRGDGPAQITARNGPQRGHCFGAQLHTFLLADEVDALAHDSFVQGLEPGKAGEGQQAACHGCASACVCLRVRTCVGACVDMALCACPARLQGLADAQTQALRALRCCSWLYSYTSQL